MSASAASKVPAANRLVERMAACQAAGRPALVIYLTQGDPSPAETVAIVRAAADAGADVIELGVPFSDPSADGPVIQQAMERAIAAGGSLPGALEAVAALRASGCEVPVVLFGYYNPLFVMGPERFAARAAEAGVDAVLTVDLPVEEIDELRVPLAARGIGVVPLLAPTSTDDRLARVRALAPPFVYYVSITGVTGASLGAGPAAERIAQVKAAAGAPVAVGFGIKTAGDAAAVGAIADGVVVGSAVVSRIAAAPAGTAAAAVGAFVAELRAGLDGVVRS
jgi:tryptophan synthase alpha chain